MEKTNRCSHPTTALQSPPCSSSSSPSLFSGSAAVSSSSSSSSSEGRMSGVGGSACEVDHSTVKIEEMEAAEALAGLAHWGVCESETRTFQFGGKWGSKGKRASQRVKTQSPSPPDSGLRAPNCSTPMSSDLAEGLRNSESEQTHETIIVKPMKAGQDIESPKPLSTFTLNYSSCGGSKLRQNMTEAEKETRRLRRVLANRESARQTIRRRQALCEELTRKATDLEWENINLRTEKELAMKEYQSLKHTNECLKAKVANTVKPEVEEAPGDFKLPFNYHVAKTIKAQVEEAPKSSNYVPSTSQRGSPNGTISFEVPLPASGGWPQLSQKESSLMNRNGSTIPFYVLPSPWFFRLPEIKHEHTQQPFNPNDRQDEIFTSNNPTVSSSKPIPRIDDPLQSLPVQFKAEALTESANKLQDGLPQGGDGLHTESPPRGTVLLPFPYNSLRPPVFAKCGNGIQADHNQAISSTEGHSAPTFIENTRELSAGPSKKQVDPITAAVARKRRKELTKLKNLQSLQCRIPS